MFFLPGDTENKGYQNIRDGVKPIEIEIRERVEDLWTEYEPYCGDRHFKQEAKTQFIQRFWEMYLAVGLLRAGYCLEKTNGEQPDVLLIHKGRRIWIEAVCPNLGSGPNAVPSINTAAFNAKQRGDGPVLMDYPDVRLIQRYTAKIRDKYEQYQKWLAAGTIQKSEPYIIAINGAGLEFGDVDDAVSQLTKSVLGFDNLCIPFHVGEDTYPEGEPFWSRRSAVHTVSGEAVQVDTFMTGAYPGISALIGANVDAGNSFGLSGRPLLQKFELLHNPTAEITLGLDIFTCFAQKVVRDGYLELIPTTDEPTP